MENKDAINRVNCGGHCCSKRVGSIMLEAEEMKEDCLECGLIDPESLPANRKPAQTLHFDILANLQLDFLIY